MWRLSSNSAFWGVILHATEARNNIVRTLWPQPGCCGGGKWRIRYQLFIIIWRMENPWDSAWPFCCIPSHGTRSSQSGLILSKLLLTCITTSPKKAKNNGVLWTIYSKRNQPYCRLLKRLPTLSLPLYFFFNQYLIQNWNPVKNSG